MYYNRHIETEIVTSIANNPVTAILGPRQSGKSTLAKKIIDEFPNKFTLIWKDLQI